MNFYNRFLKSTDDAYATGFNNDLVNSKITKLHTEQKMNAWKTFRKYSVFMMVVAPVYVSLCMCVSLVVLAVLCVTYCHNAFKMTLPGLYASLFCRTT